MTLRRVLLSLLLLATIPSAAFATSTDRLPQPVAEALARAGVPESQIGIYVHDLTSDTPVLEVGADRALNPASVMKLVTTFAALEILGPAYTWKTEAYLDGKLENGRLDGNLILKGYGDPKLTLESFWLRLRDLRNRGLHEISGDLVVDRSFFAVGDHDPAQFDNEPTRPYNVGPDALLLNFKSFRLQFVPDEANRTVSVFSEPALPQVSVVNNFSLAPGSCDFWPETPVHDGNTLTFSGSFPSGCGEKSRSFSLLAANEYLAAIFGELWRQVGGNWSGQVREAKVPATAKPFAAWESPPLSEVIRNVNKFSNNVIARQVYLALGARDGGPATLEKADRTVRDWLSARQLHFPELSIENGAGLSRSERISSRHLGQLLVAAWMSPLMPEFIASLPLAAVDGTMKRRLANSPAAGRAHIKTGYLEGVRTNAGYVLDSRGHRLAIVFLINDPGARDAQPAMEALLEWVQTGRPVHCCAAH